MEEKERRVLKVKGVMKVKGKGVLKIDTDVVIKRGSGRVFEEG